MALDLATMAGLPRELTLECGEVVRVPVLKLKDWAEVTAWLKDNVPPPMTRAFTQLEAARRAGVAIRDADRDALLRQAGADDKYWPPRTLTLTWINEVDAAEGGAAFLVWTILKHAMPGLTPGRAAEIEATMTDRERGVVFLMAQGREPPPKDGAPAPGAGATGETSPSPSPSTPASG